MQINITYDERFSLKELEKLKNFESILKEEWMENSNSTSSLIWEVVVKAEEPRLFALLKTQANHQQIHLESCLSILKKTSGVFQREFIEAATIYSLK